MASDVSNTLQSGVVSHITRLSAVDTVRARIALAVNFGLMQPGERLPSDESIAEALDVSVMSARRALATLASDGLVVRRRGKTGGTFVADEPPRNAVDAVSLYNADENTVDRLIDERTLIETALVTSACVRATPHSLDTLQSYIDQAAAADNWASYHRADEQFHLALVEASGLEWARPVHADVLNRLYQYFLPYPIEYLKESNAEHQRILDAIRRGDTDSAITECHNHIHVLHETMFTGLHKRR